MNFDLFKCNGASVIGTFDRIVSESRAIWDTDNLCSSGQVNLVSAVPKPSSLLLLSTSIAWSLPYRLDAVAPPVQAVVNTSQRTVVELG